MKKAAKFVIQGTVQGVFFRRFVKDHADKLKLTGFVRNLEKGDIEVIVEGEPDALARLENQLKKGPAHSYIRNVIREERKWSGDFKTFDILRF